MSDIDQLLQDIPVQPPVVVPVRTVQEAVAAMISHMISCCVQDCVVLLAPNPTIQTRWNHVLNSSSTVTCVPLAPRSPCTVLPTRRCPSCTSARLSPSLLLQTVSCSRLECPCFMTRPATRTYPASTFALWRTCWGAPPSFRVSLAATVTPRFHTASRTIGVSADTQRDRGNGSRLY